MFEETLKVSIDGVFQSAIRKKKNKGNLYLLIHSTKIAFARESYFANKRYIPPVSLRWLLYTKENLSILLQCSTCVNY